MKIGVVALLIVGIITMMACGNTNSPQDQRIVVRGADSVIEIPLERPEGIKVEDSLVVELRGQIENLQSQLERVGIERDDFKAGFEVHFAQEQVLKEELWDLEQQIMRLKEIEMLLAEALDIENDFYTSTALEGIPLATNYRRWITNWVAINPGKRVVIFEENPKYDGQHRTMCIDEVCYYEQDVILLKVD